jgi:anti-sigma B factor antagonist
VSLSITTTKLFSGEVEISPKGEIDVDTAHEVREAVAAAMSTAAPTQINLNLREVSFIDSVGISALVAGFQAAKVGGVKLIVTQPSRFVHRQLWVTGLLGLFGAPEPADGPGPANPEPAIVREPSPVREPAGFGDPVVLREPAGVADGLT